MIYKKYLSPPFFLANFTFFKLLNQPILNLFQNPIPVESYYGVVAKVLNYRISVSEF